MPMNLYKQVDNEVEICILPGMEPEVNKLFAREIKNGSREILGDGRIFLKFSITPEKARELRRLSELLVNN